MQVQILGTRGEVEPSAPYHSKHSGVLVDGKILLDVGEKEFLGESPDYIFITHLHPDHAFFILEKMGDLGAPVFAPEKPANYPFLQVPEPAQPQTYAGYQVTPLPTHHSKKVKSQGYVVEKHGQKLLYTGDIIWLDKKYHPYLKNLNLVITEASYKRKGGLVRKDKETGILYGHNGLPDLLRLFGQFSRKFVLVHFGSWFYQDIEKSRRKLQDLAKGLGVNLTVGYDGLKLDID